MRGSSMTSLNKKQEENRQENPPLSLNGTYSIIQRSLVRNAGTNLTDPHSRLRVTPGYRPRKVLFLLTQ